MSCYRPVGPVPVRWAVLVLALGLAAALGGCGEPPKPFAHDGEAENPLLQVANPEGVASVGLTGFSAAGQGKFLDTLVDQFHRAEVPALVGEGNAQSYRLAGTVMERKAEKGVEVTMLWQMVNASNQAVGSQVLRQIVDAKAWREGDPALMTTLARQTGQAVLPMLPTPVGRQSARKLLPPGSEAKPAGSAGPVIIRGSEGMALQFAKCCHPIPGDPIIGFIKTGRGMMIHTHDCPVVAKTRKDPEKWLDVEWAPDTRKLFSVNIKLVVSNQTGVLAKVAAEIAEHGSNIENVSLEPGDSSAYTIIHFTLQVSNRLHLAHIMRGLRRLPESLPRVCRRFGPRFWALIWEAGLVVVTFVLEDARHPSSTRREARLKQHALLDVLEARSSPPVPSGSSWCRRCTDCARRHATEVVIPARSKGQGQLRSRVSRRFFEMTEGTRKTKMCWKLQI